MLLSPPVSDLSMPMLARWRPIGSTANERRVSTQSFLFAVWAQYRLTACKALSYEDREEYATYGQDPTMMNIDDLDLYPIPPGEEGILGSHAGGEEAMCRELFASKQFVHSLEF